MSDDLKTPITRRDPISKKDPQPSQSEPIIARTVYGVQLSGSGDYGASAARAYGVECALEELIRAEKRDKRFPKPPPNKGETDYRGTKLENSRVALLRRKWDDEGGFDITYKRRVFARQVDMLQAIDMAKSVPLEYDASKFEDVAWVSHWEEPETGTLSDTDDDDDDDESECDGDDGESECDGDDGDDGDEGMSTSEQQGLLPKGGAATATGAGAGGREAAGTHKTVKAIQPPPPVRPNVPPKYATFLDEVMQEFQSKGTESLRVQCPDDNTLALTQVRMYLSWTLDAVCEFSWPHQGKRYLMLTRNKKN
jgi:hypothetical protein